MLLFSTPYSLPQYIMLRDMSPTRGPTYFSGVPNAPPTPPDNDTLDDIFGSAPASPHEYEHEILSDLPSRRRAHDTDAYREGLSNNKGHHVQEGFDEGYSLGANLGLRVGYILGVLQSLTAAWNGQSEPDFEEAKSLWEKSQKELAIEQLFGKDWVDEEGIWKWEVEDKDEDVTFRDVADSHPVIKKWTNTVKEMATKWGVDLEAVEKSQENEPGEEDS